MDISQLSELELKALAYEVMQRIQMEQNNLQIIQQRLFEIQREKLNGTQKNQNPA